MAKREYRYAGDVLRAGKPMTPRKIMSPGEVQRALKQRPGSYGGSPKRDDSGSGVRLNAYGELVDVPSGSTHGELSSGQKFGDYVGTTKKLGVDERRKEGRLAKKVLMTTAIAGILIGLLFLSSNTTGNTIADISQDSSNILGVVLLVAGLAAGFFWVKKK